MTLETDCVISETRQSVPKLMCVSDTPGPSTRSFSLNATDETRALDMDLPAPIPNDHGDVVSSVYSRFPFGQEVRQKARLGQVLHTITLTKRSVRDIERVCMLLERGSDARVLGSSRCA